MERLLYFLPAKPQPVWGTLRDDNRRDGVLHCGADRA